MGNCQKSPGSELEKWRKMCYAGFDGQYPYIYPNPNRLNQQLTVCKQKDGSYRVQSWDTKTNTWAHLDLIWKMRSIEGAFSSRAAAQSALDKACFDKWILPIGTEFADYFDEESDCVEV